MGELSIAEAAERMGVPVQAVRLMLKHGQLPDPVTDRAVADFLVGTDRRVQPGELKSARPSPARSPRRSC